MAFSFGTPASTPSLFGAAATPASSPSPFGAAATPASTPSLFSAASTPVASAPSFSFSSAPATGAVSTPAFGAPASMPSLFGAQPAASTPAFGAAPSSGGLFGAASTPSLFGAQSTPAAVSTPAFGFSTGALVPASSTPSLFGAQTAAAAAPGHAQLAALVTKENRPLTHATKWDDLSPQAQQYLLELEKKVVQLREECQQLDGDERLAKGGKDSKPGIEEGARLLSQRITSLGTTLRADSETCEALQELARRLLRNTETALYTFKRSYLWREGLKSTQGQALPSHVMEQLAGPVVLPSHYLREAVAGFQESLQQYRACAAELEQVLGQQQQLLEAGRLLGGTGGAASPTDLLQSLQAALTNLHGLLIHAAAKLQAVDDRVAAAREAHLAARRQAGDYSDPFAEAERQQRGSNAGGGGGAKPAGQEAGQPAAGGAAGQAQQNLQQQAQPAGFGATPLGAASPTPAATPGGLFGTLASPPSTAFGGTTGFGTPLFGGPAASATVRKGKKKAALRSAKIIPDVVDGQNTTANTSLAVAYNGLVVKDGLLIPAAQAQAMPNVTIAGPSAATYTLALVDLDAGRPQFLHWLVTNIRGCNVTAGQQTTPYRGPAPPSGQHRYVFLLYQQQGTMQIQDPSQGNTTGRAGFQVRDFAKQYGLGNPVAALYYLSQH